MSKTNKDRYERCVNSIVLMIDTFGKEAFAWGLLTAYGRKDLEDKGGLACIEECANEYLQKKH